VTGFKWSLGHIVAVTGVIETIFTLRSLNERLVPGIATLSQPDKQFEKMRISNTAQPLHK
jgi:3-oxoacyl-(acyl-carrier-protein) synthase